MQLLHCGSWQMVIKKADYDSLVMMIYVSYKGLIVYKLSFKNRSDWHTEVKVL